MKIISKEVSLSKRLNFNLKKNRKETGITQDLLQHTPKKAEIYHIKKLQEWSTLLLNK
jgi:hypothetical protein